jgi:hypothetical protein
MKSTTSWPRCCSASEARGGAEGPLLIDSDVVTVLRLRRGRHADFPPFIAGHCLRLALPQRTDRRRVQSGTQRVRRSACGVIGWVTRVTRATRGSAQPAPARCIRRPVQVGRIAPGAPVDGVANGAERRGSRRDVGVPAAFASHLQWPVRCEGGRPPDPPTPAVPAGLPVRWWHDLFSLRTACRALARCAQLKGGVRGRTHGCRRTQTSTSTKSLRRLPMSSVRNTRTI